MHSRDPAGAEFEIGRFICPNTQLPVPLRAAQPLSFLRWPVLVKNCPGCSQEHELELKDVQHLPVYGYE